MSSTLQRVRFTTTDYTRMASILAGRRTELIDGEIIEMAPIGTAHLLVVSRLQHRVEQGLASPGARVLVQQPLLVDTFDEPQPDLVILREALGSRKPRVGDCLVVIEVSDSTYATDVGIKLPAYLAAGVPEVWIINISDHANPMVEVWTPGAASRHSPGRSSAWPASLFHSTRSSTTWRTSRRTRSRARSKGLVAEVQPTIGIATGAYAGASRTDGGIKITNRRRRRGEAAAEENHARQPVAQSSQARRARRWEPATNPSSA